MRRDFETAPSMQGIGSISPTTPGSASGSAVLRLRFPRLDRLELALLAAFGLVSLWVLGLDLWQVLANGRVWTGTDGSYSTDQLQYLAWIQSASHHVLVSNMFVLHGTPADYFQPAVAISGLLVAVGLAPTIALLVWKPVAVLAMFLAVRAYARRALPEEGRSVWLAVIALTLFYGSFTIVYGSFGVLGDLFPGFLSWGYPFALLAMAATIFALVGYASARQSGLLRWTPGLLGGLGSLIHPWQGEVLVVTLIGAELFSGGVGAALRGRAAGGTWMALRGLLQAPRIRLLLVTVGMTMIPLLYYVALDKLDISWALGRTASKHALPVTSIALALAPLALVAMLGYRGAARSFTHHTARAWPLAAIVVFLQSGSSAGATPLHAFGGITLPLAVLAVDGCLRLGWRRIPARRVITVALILAATVPTTVYELKVARINAGPSLGNANFITRDERAALDYLRDNRASGGVLTRFYLGAAVPARTGRRTFVGDCIWSQPGCQDRDASARSLLKGQMHPGQARRFVIGTGARFILSDCHAHADLTQDLRPLLQSVRHFGCATVYHLNWAPPAAVQSS